MWIPPLQVVLLPTLPSPSFLRPRLPCSLHPLPLHTIQLCLRPYLLSSSLPLRPYTLSLPPLASLSSILIHMSCFFLAMYRFPRVCGHACVRVRAHTYVKSQPSTYNELKQIALLCPCSTIADTTSRLSPYDRLRTHHRTGCLQMKSFGRKMASPCKSTAV